MWNRPQTTPIGTKMRRNEFKITLSILSLKYRQILLSLTTVDK